MWIKIGRDQVLEIDTSVFYRVLTLYPEENLINQTVFREAINKGTISYKQLLEKCESVCIPWQLFFLSEANFTKYIDSLETKRKDKFSGTYFTKRKGAGDITSKRIIDRLIRLQTFVEQDGIFVKNEFVSSLVGKSINQSVAHIFSYFDIKKSEYRNKTKEKALEYLIQKVSKKNINVSRGVLKGGMLPEINELGSVYRNTSGFVLQGEKVPFIFLPDEINPDDVAGRRIYTLIYLLVCIGLNEFDFYLESQFKASALMKKGRYKIKHDITSSVLMPFEATDALKRPVTQKTKDTLAEEHKLTPTAVVTILYRRTIITYNEYKELLPPKYKKRPSVSRPMNRTTPLRAASKFCGTVSVDSINRGIRSKKITTVPAQYLLFGRPRHQDYKKYCKEAKL